MTQTRSFDPIWEDKYSAGHMERYPWDTVVTFVFRNFPRERDRKSVRILEVGCGTGSNLWFAAREGFTVAGVDASESAIEAARSRFTADGLNGDLRVADFTELPFDNESFDLVIDRGSLVCCGFEMAKKAIDEIWRVMRGGGKFFFNPYSDRHSSYSAGRVGPDGLILDISAGTMVGVGQICFYGRQQVLEALGKFRILSMHHIEMIEILNPGQMVHSEWRVIAGKIV
jgi:ubiquinone/menaquinone biosynthesis C-methylase UbiE